MLAACALAGPATGYVWIADTPSAGATQHVYPAGCHTWAYGSMEYPTDSSNDPGDWNGNCWVGESSAYLNDANYVAGVQSLVHTNGYGCYPTVDGVAGPETNAAIKCWQHARGLSADGIVGSATWQSLGYHTLYNPVDEGSYKLYNEFGTIDTFEHIIETNGYWYTGDCGLGVYDQPLTGLDIDLPCADP